MFRDRMPRFVGFQKLNDDAQVPEYAHEGDAGLDLHALHGVLLRPGDRALVKTGIAMAIPEGYVGLVSPRSGLALKHGISVVNAPGIIDSGYRGDIGVILWHTGSVWRTVGKEEREPEAVYFSAGDKIAQLVIVPYLHAGLGERKILAEDRARGSNGFGSTG